VATSGGSVGPVATAIDAVAPPARIALLDILRGLALFGMILVHCHQQMAPPAAGLEDLLAWGIWIFVEQKAWGTFAFLFGVGFAMLLRRAEARGMNVTPLYLRRLAALAVFGVVAEVGFGFHILFEYACWGVALLFMRRWSTRALLVAVAVIVCGWWVISAIEALHAWWTATLIPPRGNLAAVPRTEVSYFTLLAARWARFLSRLPHTWRDFIPDTNLALFVLGLLAVRHRVLEEPTRHCRAIASWMAFGAVSWAIAWAQSFMVPTLPNLALPGLEAPLLHAFGFVDDQWLCLTYIGAVTLLVAYRPQWTARLAVFGQVGRMALTNYMLQIVVLDVLTSGYGFGLRLRPYAYISAAILLSLFEAAFSRVWLAHFRLGPMEWIWRTVTYMRLPPLRRESRPRVPSPYA